MQKHALQSHHKGQCISLSGRGGIWAQIKNGRCWWEPAKRKVRAPKTDLLALICLTTGGVGAESSRSNLNIPSTKTFIKSKARRTYSPHHTHHSPTPTSSECLRLKGISPSPFSHPGCWFSLFLKGSFRWINSLRKESVRGIHCSLLTSSSQICSRGSQAAEAWLLSPLPDLIQSRFAGGNEEDRGRATSEKRDILMKILTEADTIAKCCKENLHNVTLTVQ